MEVKWIKLVTTLFDNRKIKQIRKMPEGDTILVIWFQILCLAGISNENGYIIFSKDIPYTEEMLSIEFDRPLNIVRLALATFEKFKMIEIVDNILLVSNWEKYQSVDKLEKIRTQTRERVANYRAKSKKSICNVTCNADVTQCNAIDIDIDKELDIDIDKNIDININNNCIYAQNEEKNSAKNTAKAEKVQALFEEFYKHYPKKKNKGDVEKWFKKNKPSEELVKTMINKVELLKKTYDWIKNSGQYIPYPASWLNSKGWEDEVQEEKVKNYDYPEER